MICKYFIPFCMLPLHFDVKSRPDPPPKKKKKSLLKSVSRSFTPMFSSRSFMVLVMFILFFSISRQFCEWCKLRAQFYSSACESNFSNTIYWGDYDFPIEYSWLPCQILIGRVFKGLFLGSQFCSMGLCLLFLCQHHTLLITRAILLNSVSISPWTEGDQTSQSILKEINPDYCL